MFGKATLSSSLKWLLLALTAIGGAGMTGCSSTKAAASGTPVHSQTVTVVAHQTDLAFVTPSGSSSHYPRGPLSPGDRVLDREDLSQQGSTVGSGFEVCTVSFDLNVLCDYVAEMTGAGDLHVTWNFQWPSSGTTGPTAWDGVVDGGTGDYANAVGDFHAQALPTGDINITLRILQPS
jgi:hypothetical protein